MGHPFINFYILRYMAYHNYENVELTIRDRDGRTMTYKIDRNCVESFEATEEEFKEKIKLLALRKSHLLRSYFRNLIDHLEIGVKNGIARIEHSARHLEEFLNKTMTIFCGVCGLCSCCACMCRFEKLFDSRIEARKSP
jgi:glycerol-3-phosphate O-acyltransferase